MGHHLTPAEGHPATIVTPRRHPAGAALYRRLDNARRFEAPAPPAPDQRTLAWLDFLELPSYPSQPQEAVCAEARWAASRVARLVGEVLAGERPASQLARWFNHPERNHLSRFLLTHHGLPVRLGSAHLNQPAPTRVHALLRYQLATRSLIVLAGLQHQAKRWRWSSLDILLPGPGPTGVIPRWGYDHDTA